MPTGSHTVLICASISIIRNSWMRTRTNFFHFPLYMLMCEVSYIKVFKC